MIEEVKSQYKSNPAAAIAYFYFNFNDTEKQRHNQFIRSLVDQFAWQSAKALACVESLFSCCQDGRQQPTQDALELTLQQILGDCKETFIILDALDESKERKDLLALLETLNSWGSEKLYILATSRRERDIEETLKPLVTSEISLQSTLIDTLIDNDIYTYISKRLQSDLKLKRWPENVREEIEQTLMDGAQGMYVKLFSIVSICFQQLINLKVSVGSMPAGCTTGMYKGERLAENTTVFTKNSGRHLWSHFS